MDATAEEVADSRHGADGARAANQPAPAAIVLRFVSRLLLDVEESDLGVVRPTDFFVGVIAFLHGPEDV